jgi:anti-sigma B factor antagonist
MTMTEGHEELWSSGALKLGVRIEGGGAVVTADGEIDGASSVALRELLTDLNRAGNHKVVIDMCGVTFLDSTGLGALISARKQVREQHGTLRLVALGSAPSRVIHITGLSDIFPIWDTVEDALRFD